jgi:hypothetical protein
MRRFPVALALAVSLIAPTASIAAPITLNYAGTWQFHDPPSDTPEFHAAMAAYGVIFGAQTPLSFSITIDPTIADSDPNASSGFYQAAVVGSLLKVGTLSLQCIGSICAGPAQVSPSSVRMATSLASLPPLVGGAFAPSFIDFRAESLSSFLTSDSLTSALANVNSWPMPSLMIGFQGIPPGGSGLHLGHSSLTLVSVPEASTMAMIAFGLLLFLLYRSRIRAARG